MRAAERALELRADGLWRNLLFRAGASQIAGGLAMKYESIGSKRKFSHYNRPLTISTMDCVELRAQKFTIESCL
jgi:hypothetical protein